MKDIKGEITMFDYNEFLVKKYDEKLKELMSEEEYEKWSLETAKEMFKRDIEQIEDNEFKQFCIDHFDEITK